MSMTVSMRVMSAGDGYKYLPKTVVAADGDRPLSTPLTRYYMEEGTPWGSKSSPVLIGLFLRISVLDVVVPSSALPRLLDGLAVLYHSRCMRSRPDYSPRGRQRPKPPSVLMIWPVIQDASSVVSQAMSRAGSSGRPYRPKGNIGSTTRHISSVR